MLAIHRFRCCDVHREWRLKFLEDYKHLRRRAKYVRWRIMKGEIIMRHLPGAEMIADLGTKALSAAKLRELKNLLGMTMDGGFNSQEGGMRGDIQVVVDQAVMVSEESAEAAPELTQVQKPGEASQMEEHIEPAGQATVVLKEHAEDAPDVTRDIGGAMHAGYWRATRWQQATLSCFRGDAGSGSGRRP